MTDISLLPVSIFKDAQFLYEMLSERPKAVNISHQSMPPYWKHLWFILKRPYQGWYIIYDRGGRVGNVYLTKAGEIGIFLLPEFQGKGIGKMAIKLLRERHPRKRLLANIAPGNLVSQKFFARQGFRLIQTTWRAD